MPLDVWHHVACVYNPSTNELIIYENGTQTNFVDVSAFDLFLHSSPDFGIGNRPGGATAFDGVVDDLRVYNRPLSLSEIQELAAQGPCSNPSGQTGEIIYNSTESAIQGCTSAGWQALHQ